VHINAVRVYLEVTPAHGHGGSNYRNPTVRVKDATKKQAGGIPARAAERSLESSATRECEVGTHERVAAPHVEPPKRLDTQHIQPTIEESDQVAISGHRIEAEYSRRVCGSLTKARGRVVG
jgi:hypothetical protein